MKTWHVLQARKDGLNVEFDSMEQWMADLPHDYDTLTIDEYTFNVVRLLSLKELYRRGLEAVAQQDDAVHRATYVALAETYALLCAM